MSSFEESKAKSDGEPASKKCRTLGTDDSHSSNDDSSSLSSNDASSSSLSSSDASSSSSSDASSSSSSDASSSSSSSSNDASSSLPSNDASSSLPSNDASSGPKTSKDEKKVTIMKKVDIVVPVELKRFLRNDWDFVNRQNLMPTIPCEITVDEVLEKYRTSKPCETVAERDGIMLLTLGIQDHFNTFFMRRLLYRDEKPYFAQIMKQFPEKKEKMSEICGPIHLLRLFVRMGEGLSQGDLTEKCRDRLLPRLYDFLGFLVANPSLFDATKYSSPNLESSKCTSPQPV